MSSENILCYLAPLNRQLFHVHNWSQDAQYNWFPVPQASPVNHMPLSYNFFHLSNITNNKAKLITRLTECQWGAHLPY